MRIDGILREVRNDGILFSPAKAIHSPFGKLDSFKVVGSNLPTTPHVRTKLNGIWERRGDETVFHLESFEEELPRNEIETEKFLLAHGVPKTVAAELVLHFGVNAIRMLDEDMEYAFAKTKARYWAIAVARRAWTKFRNPELFAYLGGYGLSDRTIQGLYDRYSKTAIHVVRSEPYSLLEIPGVTFEVADRIARDNNVGEASTERIEAAVLHAIREVEGSAGDHSLLQKFNRSRKTELVSGSTCIRWDDLCNFVQFILNTREITAIDIVKATVWMSTKRSPTIRVDDNELFLRTEVANQEETTAKEIHRLMKHHDNDIHLTLSQMSTMQEELVKEAGLAGKLSEEQQRAVITCLENPVSVITGGPGTGKTTIQTAILYLIRKFRPKASITMIAPTGRAAARMTESSGYPAATIHSALGLYGDEQYDNTEMLKSDVLVIDEFSMVDTALACSLFSSIQNGTKVICLGDVNQLPSVGAGAVLREIIASGVVPTALLTGVFRQAKGSSIAENAYKINDGKGDLTYDGSFEFLQAEDSNMQDVIAAAFTREVETYGLDNVCVLTPYRRNTDTGVNRLNGRLQMSIPKDKSSGSLKVFDTVYYRGDKVMYTKNRNGLANGDVGTITKIDGETLTINFGKKEPAVLSGADLNDLILAYACTIHKSQGSEYSSVILVVDEKHRKMHNKALLYTAITRAKKHIVVVSQGKNILLDGALREESSLRISRLGQYLRR